MRIGLLVFLVGHRESQGVEGAAEGIDRACRRVVLGQRSDCEQDHYHRFIRVGLKSSNFQFIGHVTHVPKPVRGSTNPYTASEFLHPEDESNKNPGGLKYA